MNPIASWQSISLLGMMLALGYIAGRRLIQRPGTLQTTLQHEPRSTTLAAAACICALLFLALAVTVLTSGVVDTIDSHARTLARALHSGIFLHFCSYITTLGSAHVLAPLVVIAFVLFLLRARWDAAMALLFCALGANLTLRITKHLIGRQRPDFETFATASSPSFPSGHTTGAVVIYGFIVCALLHRLRTPRARFEAIYWGGALILLIAASRVILSVHHTSDVLAGLLLGGFWLLAGCILSRKVAAGMKANY